jgi:hypothetical protein
MSTRLNVQQNTAARLNVTAAAITLGSNQVITNVPQTGQGASTQHNVIGANSTNLTSVKATAASINEITLSNNGASPVYFKLYNKNAAPVLASDTPAKTIMIPANDTIQINGGPFGIRLSSGIAYAITTGIAHTDTGAIPANQVAVNISYT